MEVEGRVNAVRSTSKPEIVKRDSYSRNKNKKPEVTLADLKDSGVKKNLDPKPADNLEPEREKIKDLVKKTNKLMNLSSYHLQFRIDEDSERVQVKLIDNETNETIREIPPDQMLELSARIKEIIGTFDKMLGVFIDEFI